MTIFGERVLSRVVMRKGICHKHHFCGICGKELTKINYKKGFLIQERHILITLASGLQFRRCWDSKACEKRRRLKHV